MEKRAIKSAFVRGAISPDLIAKTLVAHQSKTHVGAHDIFLGQVRADRNGDEEISAIEYSAYEEMANAKFAEIREATINKYGLSCMHIYHSLGTVNAGEVCLFVMVSAPHRKVVFQALQMAVEAIKKEVPVFGREIFRDNSYQWKVNR